MVNWNFSPHFWCRLLHDLLDFWKKILVESEIIFKLHYKQKQFVISHIKLICNLKLSEIYVLLCVIRMNKGRGANEENRIFETLRLLKVLWEDTVQRYQGRCWGVLVLLNPRESVPFTEENYMLLLLLLLLFLVWKNDNSTELSLSHPGCHTVPGSLVVSLGIHAHRNNSWILFVTLTSWKTKYIKLTFIGQI